MAYENIKINKKPKKGLVEIEAEIPADVFGSYVEKEIQEIQKEFEAPGFRKGKVPVDIIKKSVKEDTLLSEASKTALQDTYKEIISDNDDLEIMSSPKVSITKIAKDNPLGFKMEIAIMPEVDLPNYKKIAKEAVKDLKEENVEVTDKEVDDTIKHIQSTQANDETKEVPEINDEFVKKIGNFKNVKEFKEKIRENIKKEKDELQRKAKKEKIAEKLIEKIEVPLSDIAVETELNYALERLGRMLEASKMTVEEYIEKSGKKIEDFIKQEKEYITKQLKTQIILKEIAKKEKIEVETKEIEDEMNHVIMHNPQAADNLESLREYVEKVIKNEKILDILIGE